MEGSDLQRQNAALVRENQQLKRDMEKLKSRYDKLKDLYVASVKKTIEAELKLKQMNIMSKIATNFAAYFNEASSEEEEFDLKECPETGPPDIINSKVIPYTPADALPAEKLFQQFFILEPNLATKLFEVSYIYPNNTHEHLQHTRKRLFTFIFPNGVSLQEIQDDTEESRKNEIVFGSQGELLEFVLENDQEDSFNQVLSSTNLKRKYYCYVYVKPHIPASTPKHTQSGTRKHIESQRAFVFLSKFPFMEFFNDLNKSIQQTVKLLHLSDKPMDYIKKDYNIINKILKKIYDSKIHGFPVEKSWKTEISEVKLNVLSETTLLTSHRRFFFNAVNNQFPAAIISKLVHYMLIQCHLLLFCSNRQLLNETLGFIKTIIYPLMWQFSTIYSLNTDLLPFLEAPFPILMGVNKSRAELQSTNWNLQSFVLFDIEHASFLNDDKEQKLISESWKRLTADVSKQKSSGMIGVIEHFIGGLIGRCRDSKGQKLNEFQQQISNSQMMTTYLSN